MLYKVLIVHRDTGLLLLEYDAAPSEVSIDSQLLGGLLTVIRDLTIELKMGELTSFNSMDKKVIISMGNHVYAALVIDKAEKQEEWEASASFIVKEFESRYDLSEFGGEVVHFQKFRDELSSLLEQLEWKAGDKKPISERNLAGFIIYNLWQKVYYDYTDFDESRVIDVLRYSYILHLPGKKEVQIQEDNKIQYFIKINDQVGVVIFFNSSITRREMERHIRTVKFIAENLLRNYKLNRGYIEAAKMVFTPEEFDALVRADGSYIIEILALQDNPLSVIELVRRSKLRDFVTLGS